jgi:hypothetical protein
MRIHTHHSLASQAFSSKEKRLCYFEEQPGDFKIKDLGYKETYVNAYNTVADKSAKAWEATKEFNVSEAGRWVYDQGANVANWTKDQVSQAPKNVQSLWRWISNNPSLKEQERVNMLSSLQEFMVSAPTPLVQLVADAIEKSSTAPVTPEQLTALMDHRNWIAAFNSDALVQQKNSDDFYLKNDVAHRTPLWLLQTVDLNQRKAIFEQYVGGFIPANIQEKHADLFGDATGKPQDKSDALLKNRPQILGAMQAMLGGELPADDKKNGKPSYILAFESLEQRYKADSGFNTPQLRHDATRASKNPNAPSFFAGAKKLQVLDDKVLQVVQEDIQKKQEKTNLNIAEVRDGLTQLDAKTKLREATTILSRMEPWEKAVMIGVLIYGAIKFPKATMAVLGTYLAVKYVGGVQDPLGAGLKKVKEGWDYVLGKGEDAKGSVGWNHEKDPAKVAETMTHFIEGEDQQNVVEEAKVLAVLNAKSMSELSRAYVTDGKGFTLNLELLYGERKNIPPYLKQEDHCRAMTQAVGYLLFSHYRSTTEGLTDKDVKMVSSRMANLQPGKSWTDELRQNPKLNSVYSNLILKGKASASGDSRQLHQFVLEQVGGVDAVAQSKAFESQKIALLTAAQQGTRGAEPIRISQEGGDVLLRKDDTTPPARIPLSQFIATDVSVILEKYIAWRTDAAKRTKTSNPLN